MSELSEQEAPDVEGELPPAAEAWSIDVPEADQSPPDLASETAVGEERVVMGIEPSRMEMPAPVEAWTDEILDESEVAADRLGQMDADTETDLAILTDFPELVPTWSVPGVPNQRAED
jgi:hypothetical protein